MAVHGPSRLAPHRAHRGPSERTYGRAFWTGDISPLQELSARVLDSAAYLFDIEPRARYDFGTQRMNYHLFGDKYIEVPNEPEALVINYLLAAHGGGAAITLKDSGGRVVRRLDGAAKAGFNRVLVPLGGGGTGVRGRGAAAATPLVVGDYTVTVDVAGQSLTRPARVRERIARIW